MSCVIDLLATAGLIFWIGYCFRASIGWRIPGWLEGRRLDRKIRRLKR